eukprot:431617_1
MSYINDVNLFPDYLINDDIFEIFRSHFAVSYYVNYLKNNLCFQHGKRFEIETIVIPKNISCVYGSDIILKSNIKRISTYLAHKQVENYVAFRIKRNKMKSIIDIANEIKSHYDIEDITFDKTSKLFIIVDRRGVSDIMYVFPRNGTNYHELNMNYCIGFNFVIENNNGTNKVISHLKYGINSKIRFFPELLTQFVPRLFVRQNDISEALFLDKIYDSSFKHGFNVDLQDDWFATHYKMFTGYTHCSVNINRLVLHEEINNEIPMLCFMQILFKQLESTNFNSIDMKYFAE